ncbi:MAG: GAF domain-containing protein [Elainella sp. Prado103]|jgi:hypothetical protein|nr:GAF domain-containing protein [Elainella sp. Prado103]
MVTLPLCLEAIFAEYPQPEQVFQNLLPGVGDVLNVDRCFLEIRQPIDRCYRIFCWRRSDQFPDLTTDGWQPEQPWEQEDPLFEAALRAEPSIFVEDIETANPEVLNLNFEQQSFGHRALIHAHIRETGTLWGILQPCVFEHPRVWSPFDRAVIHTLTTRLLPWVKAYAELSRELICH